MIIAVVLVVWGVAARAVWIDIAAAIDKSEASYHAETKRTEQLLKEIEAKKQAEKEAEAAKKQKEQEQAAQKAKEEAKAAAEQSAAVSQAAPSGNTTDGCNTLSSHSNPASIDVMVNKKQCLQPLAFTPPDLTTTHGATISAKAANDFNRMFDAAAAAGQPFTVSSSYRSYQTQVSTYSYWVSVNGQQGADTVSARPGFSEHQTGFAVDVGAGGCNLDCFKGTSQYQWFQAHAAEYGFIQRYYAGYEHITGYAGEEWHYRYVGRAVAEDMKARGIKTLEQYWGIEGGNYR